MRQGKKNLSYLSIICIFLLLVLSGCITTQNNSTPQTIDRESTLPATAVKVTPETDLYPPQLHTDEWETPVPTPYPISTAGAEDSPFITPDGITLYFFFTPDVRVPVEKQILDGVTGIYVSKKQNNSWSYPERIMLQDPGKLSLDGAEFIQNNTMWFASAREGYDGVHWFTAELKNNSWTNWKNADFSAEYQVGELHISHDGTTLYFHSNRTGGSGGLDLWSSRKIQGVWQEPVNIEAVNTVDNEGWPFLSQDGAELWFLRTYYGTPAIYQSKKINDTWQEPRLIVSQFAGEPCLDEQGNIYFVHHFYNNGTMIEADIYVSYKK